MSNYNNNQIYLLRIARLLGCKAIVLNRIFLKCRFSCIYDLTFLTTKSTKRKHKVSTKDFMPVILVVIVFNCKGGREKHRDV